MFDIIAVKMNAGDITDKRRKISELLIQDSDNIKGGSISKMSAADIELLFLLYDRIFFNDWFRDNFKGKLKFSLSRQMTKSAGLTRCPKNIDKMKPEEVMIEIKIGVDFFLRYGLTEGSKRVGGVETGSSLEALQLVLEHELCHVVEFIHFGKSSCKGKRFKDMANNLFGHTESYHKLPTQREIVSSRFGFRVGDTVSFTYEEKKLEGILNGINKRATVMVRDRNGRYTDRQGTRYSKYYVPLGLLE